MAEQLPVDTDTPVDTGQWLSLDEMLASIEAVPDPVVALSITGGGASGAYQAGAISALLTTIRARAQTGSPSKATPRIIVGTSAGSLNAFGLLLDHLSPQPAAGEPTVAALWRTIGAENDGARFVTGRRAGLVQAFTRWLRLPSIRRALIVVTAAILVLLVNPVLFALFATRSEYSVIRRFGDAILENPTFITLFGAAVLAIVVRKRHVGPQGHASRAGCVRRGDTDVAVGCRRGPPFSSSQRGTAVSIADGLPIPPIIPSGRRRNSIRLS